MTPRPAAHDTALSDTTTGETIGHVTLGEVLLEEFMRPLGISANALSRDLDVPPNRITAILAHERAITPDTALRLSRYFGTSAQFWLNLQTSHDLSVARGRHLLRGAGAASAGWGAGGVIALAREPAAR